MAKRYRRNVAAVVINGDGKLLACERSDVAGAWQLPQGGINESESAEEALFRELEEEIGTREVEIVGRLPEAIRYDWPPELFDRGYHGQEQSYFLVRLKPEAQIDLNADPDHVEFRSYRWLSGAEFLNMISGFKAEAYRSALQQFCRMYPGALSEEDL